MLPNLSLHSPGHQFFKENKLDSLDMTIQFYSSFDTDPRYFLTALVLVLIPIPVSVEPYLKGTQPLFLAVLICSSLVFHS